MVVNQIMRYFCLILLSILSTALISSCGSYPCGPGELNFQLMGFTDHETDTIIIRRLKKNSQEIIGSTEYNPSNPVRFERIGDTLRLSAYPADILLKSTYDYEMIFPVAGRTFHIKAITEEVSYSKKKGLFGNTKEYCMNAITTCMVDGILNSTFKFPNTVYLTK